MSYGTNIGEGFWVRLLINMNPVYFVLGGLALWYLPTILAVLEPRTL